MTTLNSQKVAPTEAVKSIPWNTDTMYDFQQPATATDGLHSSASFAALQQAPERVVLDLDPRVSEGRQLVKRDADELGGVSDEVLNEVRSGWPV